VQFRQVRRSYDAIRADTARATVFNTKIAAKKAGGEAPLPS